MNSKPSLFTHQLDAAKLPAHLAVIMDGNGRWAKRRLLNRVKGHEKGAETVRMVVRTCRELDIPILTLYAFSTENWQRPQSEIKALMHLLKRFLVSETDEMLQNGVRLNAIGQTQRLPGDVRAVLEEKMALTAHNTGLLLNLALSYGSRTEITRMVRNIAREVKAGRFEPQDITTQVIRSHLYTKDMPDPDLLIRTSGEMRISNFLLWQLAYTEISVTKTLWPDLTKEEFFDILKDFQSRKRRYGNIDA